MPHGVTSATLRQAYMDRYFAPLAAEWFAEAPQLQSIVFAVAQYWDDEAADAVQCNLYYSAVRDPQWPAVIKETVTRCMYPTALNRLLTAEQYTRIHDRLRARGAEITFPDHNGTMITAFAAYCVEGGNQEADDRHNYRPYAIARRGAAGAEIEVIGKMLRPEWENRFDVGWRALRAGAR